MPITIYPADDNDCTLVSITKILKASRDDLQTLFDILPSNRTWQFNSYLTEGDRIIQLAISHNRADIHPEMDPLVLQNLGFVH